MADGTKIEWADATLNYANGCSLESPGCTNCYAMKQAHRFPVRQGLTVKTKGGMVWTGEVRENPRALEQALSWKRGRAIFWNAHGDLFHPSVPDAWIDRQFAVMGDTPQHRHMVLTKRSARMREYLAARKAAKPIMVALGDGTLGQHPFNNELQPPANVWLGVSVEDQARADERIPDLLDTPAAVRFISAEPLLGPVDLDRWVNIMWQCSFCRQYFSGRHREHCPGCGEEGGLCGSHQFNGRHRVEDRMFPRQDGSGIDWVIAGGESGPSARPMHPDWARSLRDQCAGAGVAFHFKQWGEWGAYFGEPAGNPGKFAAHHSETGRWSLYDESPRQFWIFGADSVRKRVGKKAAGRLLDGVEHNGLPA